MDEIGLLPGWRVALGEGLLGPMPAQQEQQKGK